MRIGFAGTPEFAVPALRALLAHCAAGGGEVAAVWTQPDRPAGRGRRVSASPVKAVAQEAGIDVLQPRTLRGDEAVAAMAARELDLLVVVAYGLLLPQAILDTPRLGCVNVHASLLPRWRGAAPIQRAIEAGDTVTGVGIMRMEAGLDTGPLWRSCAVPIAPDDTGGTLHDTLAALGASELIAALPGIAAGAAPTPQDDTMTTYARKLDKAEAELDFTQDARALANRVRAFNPWPVAFTHLDGERLRVWRAHAAQDATPGAAPGTVLDTSDGIAVACGAGTLVMTEVQAAGGRAVAARDFVNARPCTGRRLGGAA